MAIDVDELMDELVGDESLRRVVYDDATGLPLHPGMVCKGHPTIGVGRALDVRGLTVDEIKFLLRNDAVQAIDDLTRALPWFETLDSVRQAALADMAFNLGLAGLLGFHQTLSSIQTGDYKAAAAQMLASKWAGQVGDRAKRLASRIETGKVVPQ
jgi:lysozyme